MKAAVLLFLSIMLLQLSWPCQDLLAAEPDYPMDSQSLMTSSSADEGFVKFDECSPFCQCACCSTPSLTYFTTLNAPLIITDQNTFHNEQTCDPTLQASIGIWQPPKL